MWTQIVGKACLALTPLTNHYWNVALRITARGLATPTLGSGPRSCTMLFDFVDHVLAIECADGRSAHIALAPKTVAHFYGEFIDVLRRLDIPLHIWPMPVEVPDPVRFDRDVAHASYDRAAVSNFWRIILSVAPVLERFRAGFAGKCSPVHFFWGSFDLAVTRFSGRRAPDRPGADQVTREAYSHEVISHGFWPGSGPVQEPAFYAYAAPEPPGFKRATLRPARAFYHPELSEFILPYEAVRVSASPEEELTAFLESTYDTAADLAGWSRAELERS
jgi:hypothetical protein